MTELMKRYEAETGKKALVTVKVGFAELVFPSNEYTAWLEAQLTWRPVSEKPEKDGLYLIQYSYYNYDTDDDTIHEGYGRYVHGNWIGVKPLKWLPIPPALKEEQT